MTERAGLVLVVAISALSTGLAFWGLLTGRL